MWLALKIWDITLDINYKKEKISVLVTDYLENQMYVAISASNSVMHKEAAVTTEKNVPVKKKDFDNKKPKKNNNEYEEKLIEEVLDEFLM